MAFWRLYYHLVWCTQDREPWLTAEIERHLYPYLVAKARELGVKIYASNGWVDHVHLVVSIPPKHAVADVVKRLKGASSYDLNHVAGLGGAFAWQRGYGALTCGEIQRPIAQAYVAQQKEHHRQNTAIAWLERTADFDEGPADRLDEDEAMPPAMREELAVYDVWGAPPF